MPDASRAKAVKSSKAVSSDVVSKPASKQIQHRTSKTVGSKKAVPRDDVEGHKIDYSEEGDLPEPDMSAIEEDIAAEIEQEIMGSNMPSVDLTLVRPHPAPMHFALIPDLMHGLLFDRLRIWSSHATSWMKTPYPRGLQQPGIDKTFHTRYIVLKGPGEDVLHVLRIHVTHIVCS